ncbi:MAG: tRNA (N(6)-L-threonylcarbamoyladenosine(37)-C(2))-methylthiotransferase MtaB [Bacteroidales bacterium]|jgi:threonylcarbamoyladenosine tRNA methylthiotransferase MtaB
MALTLEHGCRNHNFLCTFAALLLYINIYTLIFFYSLKSIAIKTLGCKLNFTESAHIERLLKEQGYVFVPFEQEADMYVINTCAVTEQAEKKCAYYIHHIKNHFPQAKIALMGCFSALRKNELQARFEVDIVLGSNNKFELSHIIPSLLAGDSPKSTSYPDDTSTFIDSYSLHERTRSFLKIQDGCNYYCTYCTIPYARGHSRSDSLSHVITNAEKIVANGIKEIILSGVNIGDFRTPEGEGFYDLLLALEKVKDLKRIRISSIEPNLLTHEIIRLVSESEILLPHFHIPLQSGSDKILKLMKRRYNCDLFTERIHFIKQHMPHACIAVDVIAGFPGETEEDLQDTYAFLERLPISYLHVFPYSRRPGTPAYDMPNQLSNHEKSHRAKVLIELSDKKKLAFYKENLNSVRQVLIESTTKQGYDIGFTENYIRVKIEHTPRNINNIQTVRLNTIDADGSVIAEWIEG